MQEETLTSRVIYSNADLKAGTTIEIVPAPPVGKYIVLDEYQLELKYGGTSAFTGTGSMETSYATGGGTYHILGSLTTFWLATTDTLRLNDSISGVVSKSNADGSAVLMKRTGTLAGNAENNNYVVIVTRYRVVNSEL